jgi:hypothetical protein
MGKIRVQDLAKMMGISNQDLVFKLKSIGVRVEGDDAHIDTDIIQAILAGKKLPHPREVILRDEQTPPTPAADVRRRGATALPASPAAARRPAANPLRPQRPRTLIQKVEPRIQNLPVTERPAPQHAPAMAEALAPQLAEPPGEEAMASVAAATAAAVETPPPSGPALGAAAARRPSGSRRRLSPRHASPTAPRRSGSRAGTSRHARRTPRRPAHGTPRRRTPWRPADGRTPG